MARSFNGTSDFIDLGTVAAIYGAGSSNGKMSFSAWIFPTGFPNAYNGIIAAFVNNYEFFVKSTGKLALYAGGAVVYDGSGTFTLSANTWYQVGFTLSAGTWTGYVNGSVDATASANTPLAFSGDANLGEDPQTTGRFLQGGMADAGLWDTIALSTANMATLAAGRRANNIGTNANFVGYWPLICQSPEPDLSGNGHPGVLNGTTCTADPPQLDPLVPAAAVGILGLAQAEW